MGAGSLRRGLFLPQISQMRTDFFFKRVRANGDRRINRSRLITLSFSSLTKQFGMRTKTNEFYYIFFPVIPYKKIVILNMAFHEIFPFAFQWMWGKLIRNSFSPLKSANYIKQYFNLFFIPTKTLKIFLELRNFTDFFHAYSIESMKLSKLSVETTPASFPHSASFMAATVTALGTSSNSISGDKTLLVLNILTPRIVFNTAFKCVNIEEFSTCKVNVAISLLILYCCKYTTFPCIYASVTLNYGQKSVIFRNLTAGHRFL